MQGCVCDLTIALEWSGDLEDPFYRWGDPDDNIQDAEAVIIGSRLGNMQASVALTGYTMATTTGS